MRRATCETVRTLSPVPPSLSMDSLSLPSLCHKAFAVHSIPPPLSTFSQQWWREASWGERRCFIRTLVPYSLISHLRSCISNHFCDIPPAKIPLLIQEEFKARKPKLDSAVNLGRQWLWDHPLPSIPQATGKAPDMGTSTGAPKRPPPEYTEPPPFLRDPSLAP